MTPTSPQPSSSSAHERLASPELRSAVSRASRRLMPMLVVLYVVAFLDRTNVGFAEEGLEVDRGISAAAYAFGAGVFFVGYALFEIPSNLALQRFGAKAWLARIAITWGLVSAAFAFVQGETSFIVLRFLLGVTEAGLFPGVIMFLAEWFPNRVRVQMFAVFYLAQPFSQMIGAPLSGALISIGDRIDGVAGWQLMFAVEGGLAVVAGVAAFFLLTNSPQEAKFLDEGQKRALREVMADENAVKDEDGPRGVAAAMRHGKVWYFTVIYFCLQIAVYGVTFYLPQQVSRLVGRDVGWEVGLLAAIPWFFGLFACYFVGRVANTVHRRRLLGTLFFTTTGLCIFGSAWAGSTGRPVLGIVFITLAVCSFLSTGPICWSFPTAFLAGTAAAAGIGLINSLGNLGGFVAPILRANIAEAFGSDDAGLYALGVLPFLAAAMMWGTKRFTIRANTLLDVRAADERSTTR
ncbi:MFS transporter [Kineococcus sp. SYSU DK005]|uniref:MFS transporter n=1 Tax=Kineococcus sp. SYSU DK005 TaxID=3383126 RepID=UPI003D7EE826